MGLIASRARGVEEVEISVGNAYRYPPKSGNYFGSHFFMGGERFEAIPPESYLFGENQDLNFLGCKPIPFPCPLSRGSEPTKPLAALINIRKDTVRLVKCVDGELEDKECDKSQSLSPYKIEFIFDSEAAGSITVLFFVREEFSNSQLIYHSREPSLTSHTVNFEKGINQGFSEVVYLDIAKYSEDEWSAGIDFSQTCSNTDSNSSCNNGTSSCSSCGVPGDITSRIPMIIVCEVIEPWLTLPHQHVLYCALEKQQIDEDNTNYSIKPLKQKQVVEGMSYLLQEVYGLENKTVADNNEQQRNGVGANEQQLDDDDGSECVICMCDTRDTLILPCRHLCLCSTCADSLRYQANNCPICRSPFRALLQIRALERLRPEDHDGERLPPVSVLPSGVTDEHDGRAGPPSGYRDVPLLDVLNGVTTTSTAATTVREFPTNKLARLPVGTAPVCAQPDASQTRAAMLPNRGHHRKPLHNLDDTDSTSDGPLSSCSDEDQHHHQHKRRTKKRNSRSRRYRQQAHHVALNSGCCGQVESLSTSVTGTGSAASNKSGAVGVSLAVAATAAASQLARLRSEENGDVDVEKQSLPSSVSLSSSNHTHHRRRKPKIELTDEQIDRSTVSGTTTTNSSRPLTGRKESTESTSAPASELFSVRSPTPSAVSNPPAVPVSDDLFVEELHYRSDNVEPDVCTAGTDGYVQLTPASSSVLSESAVIATPQAGLSPVGERVAQITSNNSTSSESSTDSRRGLLTLEQQRILQQQTAANPGHPSELESDEEDPV